MANNIEKFNNLINFYNQMSAIMSAVSVNKGGIAMENYVGRFFAADVLEFIIEYGKRLNSDNADVKNVLQKLENVFENVKNLTTPTQKPVHEMSLAEFEKVMNI